MVDNEPSTGSKMAEKDNRNNWSWAVSGAVVTFFLIRGCGSSALPPPVTLSIRDSIFADMGKVVQIRNDSNHHLYNVRVVGRSFKDVSSASVRAAEELTPSQTIEVGWRQFKSWAPRSGETIEVYCDNYVTPKALIIP